MHLNYEVYIFFLVFLSSVFALAKDNLPPPPAVPYMDQVVKRKKALIMKKCLKHIGLETGFIMVELKVSREGKTSARLVATELKNKTFLTCVLSVLDRIQFKRRFTETTISRIYRFFVL